MKINLNEMELQRFVIQNKIKEGLAKGIKIDECQVTADLNEKNREKAIGIVSH